MTERLLQYIWQFQYFNMSELQTTAGKKVQVIHPGFINTHQGPDFTDAKMLIDDTIWAGNVELHLQTSQWHLNGHHTDKNYNNVILHVVWAPTCQQPFDFKVTGMDGKNFFHSL